MDKTNEGDQVEEVEVIEEDLEQLDDTTDWKAKAQEIEQKRREDGIRSRERTKALKDQLKEANKAVESVKAPKTTQDPSKAEGLDETALDYLDVKGIDQSEDIKVIEDIVKKTGMTVRQALKDDYVQAKLNANKAKREVKDATPSSTKRSGGNQGSDLAADIAKYEQSGYRELPKDFARRSAVVNAVASKLNPNKPAFLE
jgi:hypothetical protein